jgi:MFS family permease
MTNTTISTTPSSSVNWKQLLSLAFLNASVVISWIAYHNFQPKVLEKFEVADMTRFLLIAQAIILVCIPALAGYVGDYMIKKSGNRFVVFTVGIGVTAMVFMAVAFSLQGNPLLSIKYLVPFLMVIWLISMNIFHSPANSMLELFAPASQLPFAMSVLAMVSELTSALEPIIINLVEFMGASGTFAFGGFLMLASGYFFLKSTKNVQAFKVERAEEAGEKDHFLYIVLIGTLVGGIMAVIMNVLPGVLSAKLGNFDSMTFGGKHFASIILGLAALVSMPFAKIAEVLSLKTALYLGLSIAVAGISGIILVDNQWIVAVFMVVTSLGFSLSSVSAFPLVLQNISLKQVTFGTGLFFGFNELVDSIMNILS